MTGLVIDMMRKMLSFAIGRFDSEVHHPVGFEVRDATAAGHQRHRPGDVAGIDMALDRVMDGTQPFRREPDVFGPCRRDRSRQNRRDQAGNHEHSDGEAKRSGSVVQL